MFASSHAFRLWSLALARMRRHNEIKQRRKRNQIVAIAMNNGKSLALPLHAHFAIFCFGFLFAFFCFDSFLVDRMLALDHFRFLFGVKNFDWRGSSYFRFSFHRLIVRRCESMAVSKCCRCWRDNMRTHWTPKKLVPDTQIRLFPSFFFSDIYAFGHVECVDRRRHQRRKRAHEREEMPKLCFF